VRTKAFFHLSVIILQAKKLSFLSMKVEAVKQTLQKKAGESYRKQS